MFIRSLPSWLYMLLGYLWCLQWFNINRRNVINFWGRRLHLVDDTVSYHLWLNLMEYVCWFFKFHINLYYLQLSWLWNEFFKCKYHGNMLVIAWVDGLLAVVVVVKCFLWNSEQRQMSSNVNKTCFNQADNCKVTCPWPKVLLNLTLLRAEQE